MVRTSGLKRMGLGATGGREYADTGAGGGGVGSSKPNIRKSSCVWKTSTVSGSVIVRTSSTGSPVEIPNGTKSRPVVVYTGYFSVLPIVIVPRRTTNRSTPTTSPSLVGKRKSLPEKYSMYRAAWLQVFIVMSK